MSRAPVVAAGALFAWTAWGTPPRAAHAAELALPFALFAEGDWTGCRREALRTDPDLDAPGSRLLYSAARVRLGVADAADAERLSAVATETDDDHLRALAAFELGALRRARGEGDDAIAAWSIAFHAARSPRLFARAGYGLYRLLREQPDRRRVASGDWAQLQACRPLWTRQVRRDVEELLATGSDGALSPPASWLLALYRRQIGPAIGQRCSLTPSCSEYFRQAALRHGLLALPLQADRFVREPSVVAARARVVRVGNGARVADPLSDHDRWWTGAGNGRP